jgi:putative heme-binding domain-containing protein
MSQPLPRWRLATLLLGLLGVAAICPYSALTGAAAARDPVPTKPAQLPSPRFRVPSGFVVEKVAGPPLVRYPLFAAFDDRGRLFVAEGTGTNLPGKDLVGKKLGRILVLEDTDGDGKVDTSKVYADGLVFPTGVLWQGGTLYATSHPSLWRFPENPRTGRADRNEPLVSHFNFNGNGCDIHGPFLGPDGWFYWTDGRHGYKVKTPEGPILEGFASRVWRCRPDGTGIERVCGGGFDNPVELVFTPEGEMIGTMDQGPGDALLHYVEGGVYPMEHPCLKEFIMTGPMLGSVRQYTAALPVALCGLARYRSGQLGDGFRNSLFTAQFNVHRIEQHTLVRDGATFRSVDRDFVTSSDPDVHLTDVLEDADGSLLFVDMGAWFNYGCPTSKIARPEVLGAIYRVRRRGAAKVVDPWGKSLRLKARSADEMVRLLDDPRPKVRDQVVAHLAQMGKSTVPSLAKIVEARSRRSALARRNAVWSLCRIHSAEALAAVRTALADPDATVRHAAVHVAGLEKDEQATTALSALVIKDEPGIRRKAAEGLGRIGKPQTVPALLEGVRQAAGDRFLEHSLIYALIRINHAERTRAALRDPNPRVRRAGLIALDQMPAGHLDRGDVVPLLDTDDADLQQAALAVISRRPGWSRAILGRLRQWLTEPRRTSDQERSLTGVLLAFAGQAPVQQLVADVLAKSDTPISTRVLLLTVLVRCRLDALPPSWQQALAKALGGAEPAVCRQALAVIKARNLDAFDTQLARLSLQEKLAPELRIAALDCLAGRLKKLEPAAFAFLLRHLSGDTDTLLRVVAARALGASPLDRHQLLHLTDALAQAGPLIAPLLLPAFERSHDPAVARALVKALERSPGASALSATNLERTLKGYPLAIRRLAHSLQDRLFDRQKDQAAYLGRVARELGGVKTDPDRGRQVFFSTKAACAGCHRAAGQGGRIGPDLSRVGAFRSRRDLLESIVYPSSSIVPEFRSYQVTRKDGKVFAGLIVGDHAGALHLRTADLAEIRIARKDVDDIAPSNASLMPEGLEKALTRQELGDLIEFLLQQK